MAAQMNYDYGTPKGVPGGKFDLAYDEVVSRINEAEDGVLKFGIAVAVGSDPGFNVTVPNTDTTAEKIDGIVLCHPNTEQDTKGNVVIRKNATVGIMRKGHIWGRLDEGVTPSYGEKAYVSVAEKNAGTFTNVPDGALVIGASFGTESDDGIAVIVLK